MSDTWRRFAIASWRRPRGGLVHAKLTVDATAAIPYLKWASHHAEHEVGPVHLVGKAAAIALVQMPRLNAVIRLWRTVPRSRVDLAFLVPGPDGALLRIPVPDADALPIAELARALGGSGQTTALAPPSRMAIVPAPILRRVLWVRGLVASILGPRLPLRGWTTTPFGSCVITDVGALGLDEAYVPPVPWARVPLTLQVGAVVQQPVVVDGAVVVRPQLPLTLTLDPRFADTIGVLATALRDVLEQPWQIEGMAGPPVPLPDSGPRRLTLQE